MFYRERLPKHIVVCTEFPNRLNLFFKYACVDYLQLQCYRFRWSNFNFMLTVSNNIHGHSVIIQNVCVGMFRAAINQTKNVISLSKNGLSSSVMHSC